MSAGRDWLRWGALVMAGMSATSTDALTVPELQRLLKSGGIESVAFEESRESPWLAAPVQSRGTMHSRPGLLEKRVVSPRQETWRLKPDRMEWIGPDGVASRQILFVDAPALAALANALRLIAAADLAALEADFRFSVHGDERHWTVRMQPRSAETGRHVDYLELQGASSSLQTLVIVERQGERTTTRFQR